MKLILMKQRLINIFSNWKVENYVLAVSLIANIVLALWMYSIMKDDQKPNEELLKSQGRVEVLERELEALKFDYISLDVINDSLEVEIDKKPKERIVIKKIYDEKIITITNMSLDSSVGYISTKLSEINLD